jgi:hypothetical protein
LQQRWLLLQCLRTLAKRRHSSCYQWALMTKRSHSLNGNSAQSNYTNKPYTDHFVHYVADAIVQILARLLITTRKLHAEMGKPSLHLGAISKRKIDKFHVSGLNIV